MAKKPVSGKANPPGFMTRPGPVPGASIATGGPWPNAPLSNTNFKAGGSSQNVAPVMKTGKSSLKGSSKVAP